MKVELLKYFGDDLMVVNAARVSYDKFKNKFEDSDEKLIKYLVKHKHTSPFRHPQLQFRIECPIFVERQLFKHQVGLCLSGDTLITFVNSSGGLEKTKLLDLYNGWTYGRHHQKSQKDADYYKKRIKKRKIRVLNEQTSIFETSHIKDIFYSGKKDIYEITLEDSSSLKCSSDHRILTDRGWRTIKSGLMIDSMVACNGIKMVGTGMYRDKEFMKELRDKGFSVSEMAIECGCGYDNIRKWLKIHNLTFSKDETCFKKGNTPWNKNKSGYKLNLSEESRKNRSEKSKLHNLKGEKSKWWRGGITKERDLIGQWTRNNAYEVHKKYNFTCQKCGTSSSNLHAHHVIPVAQDISKAYDVENLITVCDKCHIEIHKSLENEENFAKHILSDSFTSFQYSQKIGNRRKYRTKTHFLKVISIKYIGVEDCYDIEIDGDHHNFVANGLVVHNSANSISGRYVDFSDSYEIPTELRLQSQNSKQGSEGVLENSEELISKINKVVNSCAELYEELCKSGIAKEQARIILPLCLNTKFIWTGSLAAYLHLFNLRLKPDAQKETRDVANAMLQEIKSIPGDPFKYTFEAFGF